MNLSEQERLEREEARKERAKELAQKRAQEKADKDRVLQQIKEDRDNRRNRSTVAAVTAPTPASTAPPPSSSGVAKVQVILPDGSRVSHELDQNKTVGDLYNLVLESVPEGASFSFLNRGVFPPARLTDRAQSLQQASLYPTGQVAVQMEAQQGVVTQGTGGAKQSARPRSAQQRAPGRGGGGPAQEDTEMPASRAAPPGPKFQKIELPGPAGMIKGQLCLTKPYHVFPGSFNKAGLVIVVTEPVTRGGDVLAFASQSALAPALCQHLPMCTFRLELPSLAHIADHISIQQALLDSESLDTPPSPADAVYNKGDMLLYSSSDGFKMLCEVQARDDGLSPPGYTVKFAGGAERSTELSKLSPPTAPILKAIKALHHKDIGSWLSEEPAMSQAAEELVKGMGYFIAQGAEVAAIIGCGRAADVALQTVARLNTSTRRHVPCVVSVSGSHDVPPKDIVSATKTPGGCRLLSVHGKDDQQVPVGVAESFSRAMPPGTHTLKTVQAAGHWFGGDSSGEMHRLVTDFLLGVRRIGEDAPPEETQQ
mmetsp:Transcript_20633/g.24785  ORF Transcript_20633/g.24785 Transcript_20633/m.24785 type:complete len:539 (-) Transcript_20633:341-1957(-)